MKTRVEAELKKVTSSIEFQTFIEAFSAIFKTDQAISDWVYADGTNLTSYVRSIDSKESVNGVTGAITEVFKSVNFGKVIDELKRNKEAFKFVSKWLASVGINSDTISVFKHISSGKRNLYSYFIVLLLSFTSETPSEV